MAVQIHQLVDAFPEWLKLVRGTGQLDVKGLQAPSQSDPDRLIFVGNAQHLKEALSLSAPARAWVVTPALQDSVPTSVNTVLVSPNTLLIMALIGKKFFPQTRGPRILDEAVSPRAVISPAARVGARCTIGPGAVIGDNVEIGEDCIIGANAVIEPYVKIGARTRIHPLVFIAHSCEIGNDCEIKPNTTIGGEGYGYGQDKALNHYRITHYGRVILEDRVHIGSGVTIDRGTFLDSRIGEGTKIDNHCHFGHNIVIGKNTLITGGLISAGSVTIGSYCVIGGRTTIKGHLSICDRVHLAGLSAVTKSIRVPGAYGGLPLQELSQEMRVRASLKNIPKLALQVRRILKHLGLPAEDET